MTVKCPCCQEKVTVDQLAKTTALFPFDGQILAPGKSMSESFIMIVQRMPSLYQWACDNCIQTGRAILANPKQQYYTFRYPWDHAVPFLAYTDRTDTCRTCRQTFVFTKEEQQRWYEQLSFVVLSHPVECPDCRRISRRQKQLNTELSDLLKNGKPNEVDTLLRIATLYEAMDKPIKAKEYRTAAHKARPRG